MSRLMTVYYLIENIIVLFSIWTIIASILGSTGVIYEYVFMSIPLVLIVISLFLAMKNVTLFTKYMHIVLFHTVHKMIIILIPGCMFIVLNTCILGLILTKEFSYYLCLTEVVTSVLVYYRIRKVESFIEKCLNEIKSYKHN